MVNGPLRATAENDKAGFLRHFIAAKSIPADVSNFMKIRRLFAANTGKIANRPFKPLC
jgi:hypothetical protein